jgi:hypothetical protein
VRRALTTAVVLGAGVVAGCGGGDSEEDYKEDFPPINRQVLALGEDVARTIQRADQSSDAALAEDFGNYAQRLGDLQQELDELEPPDDLAEDQDDLVAAMGDVQGSLDDIAGAAQEGDPRAARQATVELVSRSEQLRDARRTLARAVREL